MADPVGEIVKKLLPGVRKTKVTAGTDYWVKTVKSSRSSATVWRSDKSPPEAEKVEALWKSLCAALTAALGKPTTKKSMSYSWGRVRCWHHVESAGQLGTPSYVVSVERIRTT